MLPNPAGRFLSFIQKSFDRPWYLPFAAFLAGADLFIIIVPTDGLIVSYVLARPRQWIRTALLFSIGSVSGVIGLAWATAKWGDPFVRWLLGDTVGSQSWQSAEAFVSSWGGVSLLLIGASPFPLQPPVALCALSHLPLAEIAIWTAAGRLIKFFGLAWVSSKAPYLLSRIKGLRDEVEEVSNARKD